MDRKAVRSAFLAIRVHKQGGFYSINKPAILLVALARCFHDKERFASFRCYEDASRIVPFSDQPLHLQYPFARLVSDNIWEVKDFDSLTKTASGDVLIGELNEQILGGFNLDLYDMFLTDKNIVLSISDDLLNKFFTEERRTRIRRALLLRDDSMATDTKEIGLIGSETAHITRWWVKQGLTLIQKEAGVFNNMRAARVKFIAGSNRIKSTIKNWLLAADLINKKGRLFEINNNGKKIIDNDPHLRKSSSWIAIHLGICFSVRGEPYISLFHQIDSSLMDWVEWKDLCDTIYKCKFHEKYESSTIKYDLEGVRGMFETGGPLFDLGILEIRKNGDGIWLRIGTPKIPDQAIIHALALARHRHFPSRMTIHFSELDEIGFNNFLCMSITEMRNRLHELSRSAAWQQHFSFIEGKGLDSIQFGDRLNPNQTLLQLLQESEDTWL